MVDCFSRRKPESDLRCLEKAIEKGHVEAIYTYGIILISFGGELREQGLQIVSSLNLVNFSKSKTSSRTIINPRSKTERFLSNMWVYVALSGSEQIDCNCGPDINGKKSMCRSSSQGQAWETSNGFGHCCHSCFWDREAILFCRLLRIYLIT
ncbi:hypothetical protein V6N12_064904 [Hibiscus sabdariffa]|uniref:At2g35280-like TPR domain-containing protein n=1 Tax=Hibiscus sabdariffa TaxID=183260 RepID=A0ABR2G7C4_9ROSI